LREAFIFSLIRPPFDPSDQIAAFQQRLAATTLRPELSGLDGSIQSGWAGDLMWGIGVADFGVGVKNVRVQRALFIYDLNRAPSRDFSLQRAWLSDYFSHRIQVSFLRRKAGYVDKMASRWASETLRLVSSNIIWTILSLSLTVNLNC